MTRKLAIATNAFPTHTAYEAAMHRLGACLASAGWEARHVDIDLDRGCATVEFHRFDGRWVRLHVDRIGRTTLERWHRTIRLEGSPQSPRVRDDFLGRSSCEGARSGLRRLCNYVADNPDSGRVALSRSQVRGAIAPLLSLPAPA